MLKIHIEPENVWEHYKKFRKNLKDNYHFIAEDDKTQILLSSKGFDAIQITAESPNGEVYEVFEFDPTDYSLDGAPVGRRPAERVADVVNSFIEDYCKSAETATTKEIAEKPKSVIKDLGDEDYFYIDSLESDLKEAFWTFLATAMNMDEGERGFIPEKEFDEILDQTEVLLNGFGFPFIRPRPVNVNGIMQIADTLEDYLEMS